MYFILKRISIFGEYFQREKATICGFTVKTSNSVPLKTVDVSVNCACQMQPWHDFQL